MTDIDAEQAEPTNPNEQNDQATDDGGDDGAQLSEVARMDPADADTPISDGQSVAGQPDGESGKVDEGAQGPNANPHHDENTH